MDNERGKIRNRQYATQVRDFSGLRFNKITPTDIDGMIEYKNLGYVWIETKYEDAALPYGQELALVRLCDDMQKVKPCIFIVASHNCTGDIDVANTTVVKFRFNGKWQQEDEKTTTGELVQRFLHWVEFEQKKG